MRDGGAQSKLLVDVEKYRKCSGSFNNPNEKADYGWNVFWIVSSLKSILLKFHSGVLKEKTF